MNRSATLLLFKIALTIPVGFALAYPFLHPTAAGGIFNEIVMLGVFGAVALSSAFLSLVFLYCRDLNRSLTLVHPSARMAAPRSVWLMFLIPYNFVEDFFIIANVARSLEREAKTNAALYSFKSFGMVSGIGWCTAQIFSLLPNGFGAIAGCIAFPLWIIHWRFIRQVNRAISESALRASVDNT